MQIAGMVSKVFEHPFDLTKVRLQSQVLDSTARFNGPIDCLVKTWQKEGVKGLYRVRFLITLRSPCPHGRTVALFRDFQHQLLAPWPRMLHSF